MKILFDQGVPVPLRARLAGHDVKTAYEAGFSTFKNGELIAAAEAGGFELLVTTDQNLKNQQNLAYRKIGILVLRSTSWPRIQNNIPAIAEAVARASMGSYEEVAVP